PDRPHHLDQLVERLGDLAVDTRQVLAQADVEVAALERAQRREDVARIERRRVGTRGLRRGSRPRGAVALRRREGLAHASSGLPYSARRILSALAGFTM